MVPVGRLVVLRTTPKADLLRATALLTWPGLTAPLIGPPLGGFLADAHWRAIFFVNLPLGVVGAAPRLDRGRRSWRARAAARSTGSRLSRLAAVALGAALLALDANGWPSPALAPLRRRRRVVGFARHRRGARRIPIVNFASLPPSRPSG